MKYLSLLRGINVGGNNKVSMAELLELFRWKNHSVDDINSDANLKSNIEKELADVMIYAIELGLHLDIDITDAIRHKLEHNRKKYPVADVTSESGDDFYKKQKMRYRNKL